MRFSSFFGVITDSMDVVSMFDGVESVEQMVSRLESIKKRGAEDLFMNITALRMSIDTTMNDTMELGGSIEGTDTDDNNDLGLEDGEFASLEEGPDEKGEKPAPEPKTEPKT